jgi:hypothetical protein
MDAAEYEKLTANAGEEHRQLMQGMPMPGAAPAAAGSSAPAAAGSSMPAGAGSR